MVHDRTATFEWLRAARSGARQIVIEGVPWLVFELPPGPFDRRSTPSLLFESENTVRRVRSYPTDWRDLPEAALFELSWTY